MPVCVVLSDILCVCVCVQEDRRVVVEVDAQTHQRAGQSALPNQNSSTLPPSSTHLSVCLSVCPSVCLCVCQVVKLPEKHVQEIWMPLAPQAARL